MTHVEAIKTARQDLGRPQGSGVVVEHTAHRVGNRVGLVSRAGKDLHVELQEVIAGGLRLGVVRVVFGDGQAHRRQHRILRQVYWVEPCVQVAAQRCV